MKMIVDSIGNFDFNVLLAGFNDSSHVLTQVELISLIVLGVLGIGICLTGWKFVRVWAVIFGLYLELSVERQQHISRDLLWITYGFRDW